MIRVDEVRERIEARVPELTGQIGNAGEFAKVVEANQLPQRRKGAFVLPGALAGGSAEAMTGVFKQSFAEMIAVVLVVKVANDATGNRALDEITPLVRSVIQAVCGWGPETSPGVFKLSRGELVGAAQGTLIYQIDFTLDDQLRITP